MNGSIWRKRTFYVGLGKAISLRVCWLRTDCGELEVHLRNAEGDAPEPLAEHLCDVLTQLALETRLSLTDGELPSRWVRHASGREVAAQILAQWRGCVATMAWMQPLRCPLPAGSA